MQDLHRYGKHNEMQTSCYFSNLKTSVHMGYLHMTSLPCELQFDTANCSGQDKRKTYFPSFHPLFTISSVILSLYYIFLTLFPSLFVRFGVFLFLHSILFSLISSDSSLFFLSLCEIHGTDSGPHVTRFQLVLLREHSTSVHVFTSLSYVNDQQILIL